MNAITYHKESILGTNYIESELTKEVVLGHPHEYENKVHTQDEDDDDETNSSARKDGVIDHSITEE